MQLLKTARSITSMANRLYSVPSQMAHVAVDRSHHSPSGFICPWESAIGMPTFCDGMSMLGDRITGRARPSPPRIDMPTQLPRWDDIINKIPVDDAIQLTWLGQSSFLLQMNGLSILTDPVFSERCSAVQFVGPKRIMPCAEGSLQALVTRLPPIDIVIISHNHYDHLDLATVTALALREPSVTFFVPLGIGAWMTEQGIDNHIEMDWWQESELIAVAGDRHKLKIINLPAQHKGGRTPFDRGVALCSSWAIQFGTTHVDDTSTRTVFFAGDSGYRSVPRGFIGDESELPSCPIFKQIGDLFDIDLALIPIGAYLPRWFMSSIHLDPTDAVDVHIDLRARRSIAMHWATFILTTEPLDEPPQRLQQALEARHLSHQDFSVMDLGETRLLQLATEDNTTK